MNETFSKPRQQAEIAFGKAQSQYRSRDRVLDEVTATATAHEEKTKRLREARLAREEQARASATSAMIAKRARKA